MQVCVQCGAEFAPYPVINGVRLKLGGRKHCLECKPLRHLTRPRKPVVRPRSMKTCEACGRLFPVKLVIDGKMRSLYGRRFCLDCSPFGVHNTSRRPPGTLSSTDLLEMRRKRRNAKTYRYQKKRRKSVKAKLVAALGGKCADCGYAANSNALEFHHLVAATKEFTISKFAAQLAFDKLLVEARKCVLLCANCHRIRHASVPTDGDDPVVRFRRELKVRAITFMGAICVGCSREVQTQYSSFTIATQRRKSSVSETRACREVGSESSPSSRNA